MFREKVSQQNDDDIYLISAWKMAAGRGQAALLLRKLELLLLLLLLPELIRVLCARESEIILPQCSLGR